MLSVRLVAWRVAFWVSGERTRHRRGGRRIHRSLLVAICLVSGSAMSVLLRPAVALASVNLNWGAAVTAPLPGDAGADPRVALNSVACPSVGNCTAVGSNDDNQMKRTQEGLLLSASAGTWLAGVRAVPPTASVQVGVVSVACPSAGNCSAVGSYKPLDGSDQEGLLLTESAGVWAAGVEARLTSSSSTQNVNLTSIACSSAGNCVAVGSYTPLKGGQQGLLLIESAGTWGAGIDVTLLSGAAANPKVTLTSIACSSASNCAAVGFYTDSSGAQQGLLLSKSGSWSTGVKEPLPPDAATNPKVSLSSVACASPGNCVAVGDYTDSTAAQQGLLASQSAGTWVTGVKAPLPAGTATDPGVVLRSVACPSAASCTAVGDYTDGTSARQGLLASESAGAWRPGITMPLPAGTVGNPGVALRSVACPLVGYCTAVGNYTDSESAGTWATGIRAPLPVGGGSANLSSVVCAAAGSCTAVGNYRATPGYQGVLVTASPASPLLAVSGPATATVGRGIAPSSVGAMLSSGTSPTGTITFTVFGPQSVPPASCGAGGTVVGSATAAANGQYHPSTAFTPVSPGDYWWYASYDGDAANDPAASSCGQTMAKIVVTASPSVVVSAPATTTPGSTVAVSALAAVLSGGTNPTGTVTFVVFGPQASPPTTCTAGGAVAGTATVTGNHIYHPSAPLTLIDRGDYWWYASYDGDATNDSAASSCGQAMAETVVAPSEGRSPGIGKATVGHAKVQTTSISIPVSCSRSGRCTITFTLTATETLKNGKVTAITAAHTRPKITRRGVLLASTTATLTPGQARTTKLALNAAAKRLLTRLHHFTATLTVTQAKAVVSKQTLVFHTPSKPKSHKR